MLFKRSTRGTILALVIFLVLFYHVNLFTEKMYRLLKIGAMFRVPILELIKGIIDCLNFVAFTTLLLFPFKNRESRKMFGIIIMSVAAIDFFITMWHFSQQSNMALYQLIYLPDLLICMYQFFLGSIYCSASVDSRFKWTPFVSTIDESSDGINTSRKYIIHRGTVYEISGLGTCIFLIIVLVSLKISPLPSSSHDHGAMGFFNFFGNFGSKISFGMSCFIFAFDLVRILSATLGTYLLLVPISSKSYRYAFGGLMICVCSVTSIATIIYYIVHWNLAMNGGIDKQIFNLLTRAIVLFGNLTAYSLLFTNADCFMKLVLPLQATDKNELANVTSNDRQMQKI